GTMPKLLALTAPMFPTDGSRLVIRRDTALPVAWTGGSQQVSVSIFNTGIAGVSTSVLRCTFDAASGKGTIPAAALALLPADATSYSLSVVAADLHVTMVGDVYLTVLVGAQDDGLNASWTVGPITLQ